MAISDILNTAQAGAFHANAARATGISEKLARTAINQLAPVIAKRLKDKAAADPEAFEALIDLLEEGGDLSDLDDVEAMTGAEARSDGSAILVELYGSADAAAKALSRFAPGLTPDAVANLSAVSATGVLAALGASNAATLATGTSNVAETAGGGIISIIIAAILKGLMQGVARQLAPKRRRRRYTYTTTRRRTARRRTNTPGLDDIFREILKQR